MEWRDRQSPRSSLANPLASGLMRDPDSANNVEKDRGRQPALTCGLGPQCMHHREREREGEGRGGDREGGRRSNISSTSSCLAQSIVLLQIVYITNFSNFVISYQILALLLAFA